MAYFGMVWRFRTEKVLNTLDCEHIVANLPQCCPAGAQRTSGFSGLSVVGVSSRGFVALGRCTRLVVADR